MRKVLFAPAPLFVPLLEILSLTDGRGHPVLTKNEAAAVYPYFLKELGCRPDETGCRAAGGRPAARRRGRVRRERCGTGRAERRDRRARFHPQRGPLRDLCGEGRGLLRRRR